MPDIYSLLTILILLYIAYQDFRTYTIANLAIFALAILAIFKMNSFEQSFPAIVLTFIISALAYIISKRKNKTALGMGDIKLIFVLALPLSALSLGLFIWLSSLLALIIHKSFFREKELIPFGTYLSITYIAFELKLDDRIIDYVVSI